MLRRLEGGYLSTATAEATKRVRSDAYNYDKPAGRRRAADASYLEVSIIKIILGSDIVRLHRKNNLKKNG